MPPGHVSTHNLITQKSLGAEVRARWDFAREPIDGRWIASYDATDNLECPLPGVRPAGGGGHATRWIGRGARSIAAPGHNGAMVERRVAVLTMAAYTAVDLVSESPAAAAASDLYIWGSNSNGQLGNGTTTDSPTPSAMTLPSGVSPVAAAAGSDFTLIIGSDGNLYATGGNADGQLGNDTTTDSATPVKVDFPAGVTPTAVAAGQDHSLALGSDGNVYAWGYNGFGQLGDNSVTNSSVPIKVSLPAGVTATAVAAGSYTSEALGSNGQVYVWGDGNGGALGDGSMNETKVPVTASLPAGVTVSAIADGAAHTLAIGSDGNLYAWGDGNMGQLGNGTIGHTVTPVVVSLPAGVSATQIAAGAQHSLAIGSDGKLYVWGYNEYGQLGNGGANDLKTPAAISLAAGVSATAIAGGEDHSLAIGSNGAVYAWGYNANGQLGNGGTTQTNTPVEVSLPATALPATALFAGSSGNDSIAIASPAKAATTTTLSLSASTTTYGQSLTLTATVSPTDGAGSVSFLNGGTPISGCAAQPLAQVGATYQAQCAMSALLPGSYTLTASYGGDSGYLSSGSSSQSVTVNRAPLVVTSSSASMTYGGSVPAVTASYSGFVNGDTSSSLTTQPTCTTTARSSSPVGGYPSTCSGAADPNYSITYAAGSVNVDPAPLSVVASSGTMTYGASAPAISASYSGFVNGDTSSSLITQPTCSTAATSSSPVGNYPSSCTGAADANYSITDVNGMVAVGAAPLVITALSGSTTYGTAPGR